MTEAQKLVRDWLADCRPMVDRVDCQELEDRIAAALAPLDEVRHLVAHVEGINDERDSVPLLLAMRRAALDELTAKTQRLKLDR